MIEIIGLSLVLGLYAAAAVLDIRTVRLSRVFLIAAVGLHAVFLVYRTLGTGHAPFSGAYESMTFFSFLLGAKLLFLREREGPFRVLRFCTLGLILVFLLGALLLPAHYKSAGPLMPALKSVFFVVHVPLFFFGYVSLAFAFALSLAGMIRKDPSSGGGEALEAAILAEARTGYVFITAGLITGAVWAFICWGRFWGWDSKETTALVTWLLYTFGLHARSIRLTYYRWTLIFGFILVLFTYLGVMFLLPGIHSYR
jgi:ABC-type transport system involved in cytochrome c biogenesis permease subunit